ncbi:hypothetical protein OG616_24550 [Streptomyces antibioticus]|uniref:hypothetical protein n=1 Tax=Streptomyces antibioticus TaxID=1890 RepID=UPI00224DAC8D|nr:hypothetical protein [Streptomyces antibioticus]MCX5171171.1 hypothetical protein [Streptomyces antibioticus]
MRQLIEAALAGAGQYWYILFGLILGILAERLLKITQMVGRIPAVVIPRIKALDLGNPAVFFALQLLAVLVALGIYTAWEAM